MASAELAQFLHTLQNSDDEAVEGVLRELDPFLRRVIRLGLVDGRLRRVLDTTDVLDSLLKDFLARKDTDGGSGESRGGLRAYLAAAVHHKIQTRARKERRHAGSLPADWDIASPELAATNRVEAQDFHQAIRARLSTGTQPIFDLKMQGESWQQIAAQVGGAPDALRMRLTRAVAAALRELGCNGADVERR
jgi:DNA-directed RNA polymerase specialized sigma24 family protein